jgi:signal transduction histidine kinase
MQNQFPEIYVVYLGIILITLLVVGFIIMLIFSYQKKKLLQEKQIADMKTAFKNELLQAQLEIQEETMKNISMEIHDNIGQIMLLANINISILQTMPLPETAPPLIIETKKMLSKASEDISNLARSLHSDRITEIGVFHAIKTELSLLAEKQIIAVNIEDPDAETGSDLPRETQLLVFRMYQEIIKNCLKHAEASTITLRLETTATGTNCSIIDDGKGFDLSLTGPLPFSPGGVGLRSMQTRVALFNGLITINSSPGKGTNVCIFIPSNR